MDIHQDGCRPFGVHHLHASGKHFFNGGLHGQIKRQRQRRASLRRVTQACIHGFFNASGANHFGRLHAFGPKAGATEHMSGKGAIGIKPHFARPKQQARIADIMHPLHLFGAKHAAQPHEAAPVCQAALQICGVHIGKNGSDFARHANRINHILGLSIKCVGLQVGGQNTAVTVCDIGALRQDRRPRCARLCFLWLGCGQHAHAGADQRKRGKERKTKEQKTPFGAGTGFIARGLMPEAQIFAFNLVWVFALCAGRQDAGKRAQGGAGHGMVSKLPLTSMASDTTDITAGNCDGG